jgi:hypothetical protein
MHPHRRRWSTLAASILACRPLPAWRPSALAATFAARPVCLRQMPNLLRRLVGTPGAKSGRCRPPVRIDVAHDSALKPPTPLG